MGEPRVFRALGDSNRRFVENDVNAFHGSTDEIEVADIALYNRHLAGRDRGFEIVASSAGQVIEHNNLFDAFRHQ